MRGGHKQGRGGKELGQEHGKVQGRVLGGRQVQVLGGMVQVLDGGHGDQCG